MYGALTSIDPDVCENEVGAIWRELYKLEKHFSDTPNPLGMAKKVSFHLCTYVCMYVCTRLGVC